MRRLAVACGLLLALAGCTSDPAPPVTTTTARPTPAPHRPAPRPQDRDEQAVLDTLTSVNPCALVDEPADGHRSLTEPHTCSLDTKDHVGVIVKFGERMPHAQRYLLAHKVIAGAKVDAIEDGDGACAMDIPVSFKYAVTLTVLPRKSPTACDTIDGLAATVIKRLGTVSKVRHPAEQPDLSKTSCDVLLGALTDAGETTKDRFDINDLDRCHLQDGMSLDRLVEPADWGKPWATVADKPIHVDESGKCQWTWSEGTYSGANDRLIVLEQDSCHTGDMPASKAKTLIDAVIKRLEAPQPAVKLAKLTYGAAEPTEPNLGACADYGDDVCEPYQPTPVPPGAGAATRMASVDPHVVCAASTDVVHGQFAMLRPVVTNDSCVYVEPDHTLELRVKVSDTDDVLPTAGTPRHVVVKGLSGEYREGTDGPRTASLCVDSGQRGDDAHGHLYWCLAGTFRSQALHGSLLEPLMTALVADDFGG